MKMRNWISRFFAIKKKEEIRSNQIADKNAIWNKNHEIYREWLRNFLKELDLDYRLKCKSEYPPFEEGDIVIPLIHSDIKRDSLGWFSHPSALMKTFTEYKLDKFITGQPVNKLFVNTENLKEKINTCICDNREFDLHIEYQSPAILKAKLHDYVIGKFGKGIYEKLFKKLEWCIDFDWHDMKLPHRNNPEKYLNLRWGGFPAQFFVDKFDSEAETERRLEFLHEKRNYLYKLIGMNNEKIKELKSK